MKAQQDIRNAEKGVIAELRKSYLPGGIKPSWEPDQNLENIHDRDEVITPHKVKLFQEDKTAVAARRKAFENLKKEREREQKALR